MSFYLHTGRILEEHGRITTIRGKGFPETPGTLMVRPSMERARDPRIDCMDRRGDASSYFDVATYGQKSCTPTESSTAQGICMRHLTVAWHAVRTRYFGRASH